MVSNLIKVGVSIERILRSFRPFSVAGVSNLYCDELQANIKFRQIGEYSPSLSYEVKDPFFGVKEIHGFRQRFKVEISNPIVDSEFGHVFDKNLNLIQESSSWPSGHLLSATIQRPQKKNVFQIDKKINLLPSNGYYHWLIEDLPPHISNLDLDDRVTGIYQASSKFVKSFASEFAPRQVLLPKYFQPSELLLSTKTHDTGWAHPKDVEILRKFFKNKISIEPKLQIYISRTYSTRSPRWELKLQNLLGSNGWKIIHAENLEFSEQISIISNAKILCGVHGAGLANAVWMKEKSKLIEISPTNFRNCFANLATVVGLDYKLIPQLQDVEQVYNEIQDYAKF